MNSHDGVFLLQSSPLSASGSQRRRSRFTFKQVAQLGQYSTATPLRVIAHVDLDAFYAQCETIRLGLPESQPLAVQQWAGLIAVNYPARDKGITRFLDIDEAKKLCPDVVLQHVATWKEGDTKWQYHPDAFGNIATHKVSLDPYREQSRNILACIKDTLPAPPMQKVEKASVDEVFIDLSAQVHSILLERYPELKGPPPYDDPTEKLPRPPTTALDWDTDALIDLDEHQTEDDDPDWDDVALCVASEIIRGVRRAIRTQLKFTCSAGVARNKMLAKLGSGHKKPNGQTIVRNRAVQQFLSGFKFTKIRNLGGKFGEQAVAAFGTEQVEELRKIPLEQLKSKLGADSGAWLHATVRGEDGSEVNSRTAIKSMLSAKSFRPVINARAQAERWLRIFVADIFSRLVVDGVLEHRRRPRTMTLHHRQGGQTWSRQIPIPQGRTIGEDVLFDLAKNLLQQIILQGHVWPCANLSLSVGGFEDGPAGNRGIGGFLVKGDEAKTINNALMQEEHVNNNNNNTNNNGAGVGGGSSAAGPAAKKRRTDGLPGIQNFFKRTESQENNNNNDDDAVMNHSKSSSPAPGAIPAAAAAAVKNGRKTNSDGTTAHGENEEHEESLFMPADDDENNKDDDDVDDYDDSNNNHHHRQETSPTLHHPSAPPINLDGDAETTVCPRCQMQMSLDEQPEHEDWHFAKDLQESERMQEQRRQNLFPPSSAAQSHHHHHHHHHRPAREGGRGRGAAAAHRKPERGQMKLTFNKG